MLKEKNVLEKLAEVAQRENKRRKEAIKLLEVIVRELAEPLEELLGYIYYDEFECAKTKALWVPKYDKDKGKYTVNNTQLYFRYGTHNGERNLEHPGFYINPALPFWGNDLFDIKGKAFWEYTKQICDWIMNYLPSFIENHEKSRNERFDYLKNIVACIEESCSEDKRL